MANRLTELKILLDKEEKSEIRSQRYIDDLKMSIDHLERQVIDPIKIIQV